MLCFQGGRFYVISYVKNGNTPLDQGTSFWFCITFDLGTVLNKKNRGLYLPIFLAHWAYKISVKYTRQVLFDQA